jgi:hypothetical protein
VWLVFLTLKSRKFILVCIVEGLGALALKDVHHLPRAYSVDALAKINLEISVPFIIDRAENDEYPGVRAVSINALKKIRDYSEYCIKAN